MCVYVTHTHTHIENVYVCMYMHDVHACMQTHNGSGHAAVWHLVLDVVVARQQPAVRADVIPGLKRLQGKHAVPCGVIDEGQPQLLLLRGRLEQGRQLVLARVGHELGSLVVKHGRVHAAEVVVRQLARALVVALEPGGDAMRCV